MKLIIRNNKFTGTKYTNKEFTKEFENFHINQGELILTREEDLVETSTDEMEVEYELPTQVELDTAIAYTQNLLGMSIVDGLVQNEIDRYNTDNSINFNNVDSCNKYVNVTYDYPHKQFCNDIIEYTAVVYDASRAIQNNVMSGSIPVPNKDEFIALLPKYTGV